MGSLIPSKVSSREDVLPNFITDLYPLSIINKVIDVRQTLKWKTMTYYVMMLRELNCEKKIYKNYLFPKQHQICLLLTVV